MEKGQGGARPCKYSGFLLMKTEFPLGTGVASLFIHKETGLRGEMTGPGPSALRGWSWD